MDPLLRLDAWPVPFDPEVELDWGDPVMSRRLLREHLDQAHDGASRRTHLVEQHVSRLARLLPPAPARILDAACGPGLYAVGLAELGYRVTGIDVGPAVVEHATTLARRRKVQRACTFSRSDLREPLPPSDLLYDAALLIYHVLEAFPRPEQVRILRRLASALEPGAPLIAEMRARPDQPPGRLWGWDVVPWSLLSDTPHLLLTDTAYDARRHTLVLRETAVLDHGLATQQTSSRLCPFDEVVSLFGRGGFRIRAVYEGWTRFRANSFSSSLLVVATSDRGR